MSQPKTFILANTALHQIVKQIKASDLTKVAPKGLAYLPEQTLKTALNILAYENLCVPQVLEGKSGFVNNADFKEDLLKDDVQTNYAHYSDAANAAAENTKNIDQTVHISYGDFPAKSYLSDITIQRGFAAVDLALFLDIDVEMPDELVTGMWEIVEPIADQLREYQVFGPEVKIPSDAPLLDRLLGLSGRSPQ